MLPLVALAVLAPPAIRPEWVGSWQGQICLTATDRRPFGLTLSRGGTVTLRMDGGGCSGVAKSWRGGFRFAYRGWHHGEAVAGEAGEWYFSALRRRGDRLSGRAHLNEEGDVFGSFSLRRVKPSSTRG
jgi:hypothetical protein